jgi:chromosome segregation ATPase
MTDSDRASVDVAALVEERRRFEGWLAALEARRDRTPAHIYERVEADYRSRLQRVTEQLTSHRSVLQEERAGIESRLSLIMAEAKMRGDEKAELELRCAVGETAASEAAGALEALTRTLELLNTERQNLERRKNEIAELLSEEKARAEAPTATKMPKAELAEASTEPSIQDALSRLEPRLEPARATPIAPHPPMGLRPSSATEQTKSLKCAECGGMNYPTEWYCERCGAELAAL